MKFNLHGHNRDTIEPGVVGTAINGTIRLQSDFEVRYSSLFNSYIYIMILISLAAGSRFTHSMHLAIFRTWVIIILFVFDYYYGIWADGFNHLQLITARWSMSSLRPSSKWVSWVRRSLRLVIDDIDKVYPSCHCTNHASRSWQIAVQPSLNLRNSRMTSSFLLANSSLTSTNR